jgi:hypothetical protein
MKTIYQPTLFLLLFMLTGWGLGAQTTLMGIVCDKARVPVSGVWVYFNNGLLQTTTQADGSFSLTYPDTLTVRTLRFQAIGYKSKTMTLNKGQQQLQVILTDSTYNLGAVRISASLHGRFSDYSAQTIAMNAFDIVTNPSAMADLIGNMRVLPGVQTNDNDGRLIIQGGSPDESQFYINDLIIANPYHLASKNKGVRSRFTPDLFEGIVLQSGGFNAAFGQALSGVINLNTKEREQLEAKTDISLSSVFAEITHIGKKPTYAYRATVSYTNLTPYGKLFPDGYNWNKYFQTAGADFFLTKEFSPNTKLSALVHFNHEAGDYSYQNVDEVRLRNDMQQDYFYTQINLFHKFNARFSLFIASNAVAEHFSGTEVQYEKDKVTNTGIWNHSKINFQYTSGTLTNQTGVECILNPFDETYTWQQTYKTTVNNNLIGLYNDTKLFLTNNLTVSLGLRGEYSLYLKQFNVAPRVYAGYRINKVHVL